MRRREFIAGLPGLALTVPAAAQQRSKVYRVAYVSPTAPVQEYKIRLPDFSFFRVFFAELRARNYVYRDNLVIEWYSAEGKVENHNSLAKEVVRSRPDVIHTQSTRLLLAFRDETKDIPIAAFTGDPVEYGLVDSLAKPGGNITGVVSTASLTVLGKYLELVRDVVPNATNVAYLTTSTGWTGPYGKRMREAGESLGVAILPLLFDDASENIYKRLISEGADRGAQALVISDTTENFTYRAIIVREANGRRLPTFAAYRAFPEIGGTVSLGVNLDEMFRELARQIAHILDGTSPGDIPFFLPNRFELVVNRRSATQLGLQFSPTLLARADEVIE